MSPDIRHAPLLAITGIDVTWGAAKDLDDFERIIYEALPHEGESPSLSRLGKEEVIERLSRRALQDSEIDLDARSDALRVAFIAAANPHDPAHPLQPFAKGRPFFDMSGHVHPLAGALERAMSLLNENQADAVVFAAYEAGISTAGFSAPAGFGFDSAIHEPTLANGAGAIVLMPLDLAKRLNNRVYATVEASAFRAGEETGSNNGSSANRFQPPKLESVRICCREALDMAGKNPDEVEYIEASACGLDAVDGIEIAGLVQSYRLSEVDQRIALGSAPINIGYLGAAAGLAGVIRAALCLHHRMIPGVPNWNGPKLPALWKNTSFYVPAESRPWFKETGGTGRCAAVSAIGRNGSYAHLVLQEAYWQPVRTNRVLSSSGFYLIPVVGYSQGELLSQLNELQKSVANAVDLAALAADWYAKAHAAEDAAYGIAITGHSSEEIQREIGLAIKALPDTFAKGGEWQTPLGSYCTASPVGRLGQVALVYPGAFNTYPGVAKDLFRLFPGLYQRSDRLTSSLGNIFRERILYPRSLQPISKEQIAELEARLLADPISMLITGTAISVMYTHLLQDTFDIHPTAAFGYSLGENSMMYATGVWMSNGDEATARLEASDAFKIRLAGPQEAIREYWQVASSTEDSSQPLWSNYIVMAAPDKVNVVLETIPHVYMTHVNTPRQVVIGGNPQSCLAVLEQLRCSSLKAPFDYALHCEVIRSEYDELSRLHSYPVEQDVNLKMYSASGYDVIGLNQAEIAHKMADMLTTPLDFPRLVRKAYQDGARIFIEAGAGSNCARWVDEILKTTPDGSQYSHLALAMNRRGTDDYHTIIRMIARLFSHRVPMNLSVLCPSPNRLAEKEERREFWRDAG